MKHHIAVKFIAVLLASLTLLAALASGVGIIGLASLGLYEKGVEEFYQEQMQETYQFFSVQLVHRYASLNLGQLPEAYLNSYYGTYWFYNTLEYGYYFYDIIDETGNVVESTTADLPGGTTRHTLYVTEVNYRQLLDASPQEDRDEAERNDYITSMNRILEDLEAQYETVAMVTEPEDTIPLETTPDGTFATEAPEAVNEPGSQGSFVSGVNYDGYYDYESGQQIEIAYTIRQLPPYTVELYLLPEAIPEAEAWNLLKQIWVYRTELFYVLAVSLLGFAICAVYLCCAAGKKPGREELKAGGFNCIPLDLYLGGGAAAITGLAWIGFEGGEYLLRESPKIFLPSIAILGYLGCLIFVAFCFACAAQLKTPDYYWAKNSVTGRCFRLIGKLWNKCIDILAWIWARTPKAVKWCFDLVKRFILWAWNLTWRMILWAWNLAKKICLAAWALVRKWLDFCLGKAARLYGLLPLMWQWVIGGVVLLLGCILAWANRNDGWGFLWLLLSFALVLYGASCFGILLEGARRMSKGDLETKISNQFLVGSFKDFSTELNALANVAVVAAQKQMKSERMKTELITNVSHDIKTPLTSIINYVDLLEKPHTDEEQTVYLEVLSRQSLQLKKLIEDLMEMSKASTGNMNVEITSVNAGEAIHQALGEFADKLEKAQLTPVFRQPEQPVYMLADGRLAWRVMSNLLSNAVKYALPGTRVYIDLMELEGKVIISMKNISREELNVSADELLERFVRGDASRNTEGSGLGLNIAQSLMEIQKGQLQLLVDGDLFKVTLVFPGTVI